MNLSTNLARQHDKLQIVRWYAGCKCDGMFHVEPSDAIQVLDTRASRGTSHCNVEVAAGSETLLVAAYVVQGKLESDETTHNY